MSDSLYWKHKLLRTPLERPALRLQGLLKRLRRARNPELKELALGAGFIDRALEREVERGWNCIDIGAHIGSMLSLILRLAPDGEHRAFEPTPTKSEWLRKKFPEVVIRQVAVSDEPGEATFCEDLVRSGFSALAGAGPARKDIVEYRVETCRLDDELPPDYRVDFVKIDTEGAELAVLRGAVATFERWRPLLLFECGPDGPQRFGYEACDLHAFVTETLGYSVRSPRGFVENAAPLTAEGFEQAISYPFTAFNFFASPNEPVGG